MHLSTAAKLRAARALYRSVRLARRLTGASSDIVDVRRRGLNWRLNLAEGIDLSIYLFGEFERATAQAIRDTLRPGMVAFDVGANVGAHALPMARLVGATGRVYAFEPTQWAYDRLIENRDLNPDLGATLVAVHAALGRTGQAMPPDFYSSWNVNAARDSVHAVHMGSLRSTGAARALTMDEAVEQYAIDRLDFIKIDVDGYETHVMSGGQRTLARFGPPILFELCPHVLIERGTPGFECTARYHTMGGENLAEIRFDNCELPLENLILKEGGFRKMISAFNTQRCLNPSVSLGLAEGALEEAIKYARDRSAFGRPIGEFQAIRHKLAEMYRDIEASRSVLYRAAASANPFPDPYLSAVAKITVNEMALRVTSDAIQVHGGYG
ncbi:MAG: FkbM family methyltransferase, partial [Acidobacteriota bacterium]